MPGACWLCLALALPAASAVLRRGCPPEAATCKRGDYTGSYCAPLQVDIDKPLRFGDGTVNFPSVLVVSQEYCLRYLDRYAWTTSRPKDGKPVKWHRTDWVAGSCNCSLTEDEEQPRLRGASQQRVLHQAAMDAHMDAHNFATTTMPAPATQSVGVVMASGKLGGEAMAQLGVLPGGGVCRWLGIGCQDAALPDQNVLLPDNGAMLAW